MVLRLEVEVMRLAVVAQRLVVLLAARLEIGSGRFGRDSISVRYSASTSVSFWSFWAIWAFSSAMRSKIGATSSPAFLRSNFLRDAVLLGLIRLR